MQYSLEVKYLLISMANLRNNESCTHKRIFGFSRFKDGGIRCREFSWIYHNIRNYFFKELSLSLCLSVCLSLSVSLSLSHASHTLQNWKFWCFVIFKPPHNLHSKNHGYISRSKFKEINCEHLCRSNLGAFYPRISTINFGKLFYFYNLHIEGYFYSKNHAFILWGKCRLTLTLFLH